jgi:hypothetical protein
MIAGSRACSTFSPAHSVQHHQPDKPALCRVWMSPAGANPIRSAEPLPSVMLEGCGNGGMVVSTKTASPACSHDLMKSTTVRLRVEGPSSSRCRPDPSWLLTSAGSSSQRVPDLPCYGRGNDHGNDRTSHGSPHRTMATFRSGSEASSSMGEPQVPPLSPDSRSAAPDRQSPRQAASARNVVAEPARALTS